MAEERGLSSREAAALAAIDARIAELEAIHLNYSRYQDDRVRERDHHGAWDVAINLSETECEISGLQYARNAIAGK